MQEQSRLGQMILSHWQAHRPAMVEELRQQNQLDQAVWTAQESASDQLYELVSVKKLRYDMAWEIVTQEWALPEEVTPSQVSTEQPAF